MAISGHSREIDLGSYPTCTRKVISLPRLHFRLSFLPPLMSFLVSAEPFADGANDFYAYTQWLKRSTNLIKCPGWLTAISIFYSGKVSQSTRSKWVQLLFAFLQTGLLGLHLVVKDSANSVLPPAACLLKRFLNIAIMSGRMTSCTIARMTRFRLSM